MAEPCSSTPVPPTARARAARRRRREALLLKAHAEDALLTAAEAGALCGGISEQNWTRYAARWPALRKAVRVVRVRDAKSRGRLRWLKSAVLNHVREELLRPDLDSTGL